MRAISQATAPRTIRFLRAAALSPNLRVSAAEVQLLAGDSHNPIAKYILPQPSHSGGNVHHQNTFLDNQTPDTIKKMLSGQHVAWEHLALSTLPPPPPGGGSYATAYNAGQPQSSTLCSSLIMHTPVLVQVPSIIPNPHNTTTTSSSSAASTMSSVNATTTSASAITITSDGQSYNSTTSAPALALAFVQPPEKKARIEERAAQIEAGVTTRLERGGE